MKHTLMVLAIILLAAPTVFAADQISTTQSEAMKTSPDKVWALLVDVNHWSEWCPAVEKAELVKGDGQAPDSEVKFRPVIGGKKSPSLIKLVLVKSEPNHLLEYQGSQPGMNITFGFIIEDKDGASMFTSYETITGPGIKLFLKMYGQGRRSGPGTPRLGGSRQEKAGISKIMRRFRKKMENRK